MEYQEQFGCPKCNNLSSEGECVRKDSFDNDDPSTNPFLYCPFFSFNYDLMVPQNGDIYILNSNGVLYTPIYWNIDLKRLIQLRKCEIYTENNTNCLVLDMKYPFVMDKERKDIIDNSTIVHIDQTLILR